MDTYLMDAQQESECDAGANSNNETFTIESGFRPQHLRTVAAGYWEAFSRKLRYPLGPEQKALAFLEQVLDPRHSISAVSRDGVFLGIAGFKTAKGAFVGGGLTELAKIYGWVSGIARVSLLTILERKCEPGTLLMDGIFVRPEARGLGVGTALLDAIEYRALSDGFKEVRLDVIDQNPRAKSLYERQGFEERSELALGALQPVFGFRSATTMIKAVGQVRG